MNTNHFSKNTELMVKVEIMIVLMDFNNVEFVLSINYIILISQKKTGT